MKLTPQTVYMPDKHATGIYHASNESVPVRKRTDKICLSKEELVDLFTIAWNDGHISNSLAVSPNIQRDNFINNILNQ